MGRLSCAVQIPHSYLVQLCRQQQSYSNNIRQLKESESHAFCCLYLADFSTLGEFLPKCPTFPRMHGFVSFFWVLSSLSSPQGPKYAARLLSSITHSFMPAFPVVKVGLFLWIFAVAAIRSHTTSLAQITTHVMFTVMDY